MAWTTPATQSTGTTITATLWNNVQNNQTHLGGLKSGANALSALAATSKLVGNAVSTSHLEGSNYTITSNTWTDVDATDLTLSITTTGGDVLLGFSGTAYHSTGAAFIYFDFYSVTDAARISGGGEGLGIFYDSHGNGIHISYLGVATGLSAGTHTFKLQWRTTASTANLRSGAANSPVILYAMEH